MYAGAFKIHFQYKTKCLVFKSINEHKNSKYIRYQTENNCFLKDIELDVSDTEMKVVQTKIPPCVF